MVILIDDELFELFRSQHNNSGLIVNFFVLIILFRASSQKPKTAELADTWNDDENDYPNDDEVNKEITDTVHRICRWWLRGDRPMIMSDAQRKVQGNRTRVV